MKMKLSARDNALCRDRSVPWQYRLALYAVLCRQCAEGHDRGFMAKRNIRGGKTVQGGEKVGRFFWKQQGPWQGEEKIHGGSGKNGFSEKISSEYAKYFDDVVQSHDDVCNSMFPKPRLLPLWCRLRVPRRWAILPEPRYSKRPLLRPMPWKLSRW